MTQRDDAALLRLLVTYEVPFVVIGGWAVIAHGFVRATKDVDVLIPEDAGVISRASTALASVGAIRLSGQPVLAGSPMPPSGWQVDTTLGRIDLLPEGLPPLDFASVMASAISTQIDDVPVSVSGLGHLAAFKRMAGRPQDRADLDELAALHGELPHVALPFEDEP